MRNWLFVLVALFILAVVVLVALAKIDPMIFKYNLTPLRER